MLTMSSTPGPGRRCRSVAKFSASLVGGVAAAGGVWAIDIWLFHGDDWSLARFVFKAVLWAVMLPIVFWVNDRRRLAG